jgi:hypothetical protein
MQVLPTGESEVLSKDMHVLARAANSFCDGHHAIVLIIEPGGSAEAADTNRMQARGVYKTLQAYTNYTHMLSDATLPRQSRPHEILKHNPKPRQPSVSLFRKHNSKHIRLDIFRQLMLADDEACHQKMRDIRVQLHNMLERIFPLVRQPHGLPFAIPPYFLYCAQARVAHV